MDLHIWGPVGPLPSLDAECIAAVAYLARALPASAWRIVPSSDPSVSPAYRLPALNDNGRWVYGFRSIVAHLANPLDAALSPSQLADTAAYSALLASVTQPIVDAALYSSEDNWAAVSRPAFGRLLPFPVSWTLPHAVRAAALARAERLQVPRLLALLEQPGRLDEDVVDPAVEPPTVTQSLASRLRPKVDDVASRVTKKVVRERLEADVRRMLEPFAERLEEGRREGGRLTFFGGPPSSVDCLAYGYFVLMGLDAPQAFAKDAILELPVVQQFVEEMGLPLDGVQLLQQPTSVPRVVFRFVDQLIRGIPLVGEQYAAEVARGHHQGVVVSRQGAALASGVLAAGLALSGGYYLWRVGQPFGAPVHTFTRGGLQRSPRLNELGLLGVMAGTILSLRK